MVAMGFTPSHLKQRDRHGPVILKDPPFNVRWRQLAADIGLTVDEAVFDVGFTTCDFEMFGETLQSLMQRGFGREHRKSMKESDDNFAYSLAATREELIALRDKPGVVQTAQPSRPRGAAKPTVARKSSTVGKFVV